ncbi:unnamed protein product [Arabidopsis halleri]
MQFWNWKEDTQSKRFYYDENLLHLVLKVHGFEEIQTFGGNFGEGSVSMALENLRGLYGVVIRLKKIFRSIHRQRKRALKVKLGQEQDTPQEKVWTTSVVCEQPAGVY